MPSSIIALPERYGAAETSQRMTSALELLRCREKAGELAGIYALERLGRLSPEMRTAVVEVLSSFVRVHATGAGRSAGPTSTVVQAALVVLGQRPMQVEEQPLDLHGMVLRQAYLPMVHFEGAFLYDCDLQSALLVGARLQNAWLARAGLKNANLDWAHLEGADLATARNLLPEQLKSAFTNQLTRLPPAFRESPHSRRLGFTGH